MRTQSKKGDKEKRSKAPPSGADFGSKGAILQENADLAPQKAGFFTFFAGVKAVFCPSERHPEAGMADRSERLGCPSARLASASVSCGSGS